MIETFLGVSTTTALGGIGMLAVATTIVVEVLKSVLPKKFPTQFLAFIIAMIVCVIFTILFCTISVKSICLAIFMGFVTALVSMNGFDTLKNIVEKFKINVSIGPNDNEGEGEGE